MFGTFPGLSGSLFDDLSRLQRELDEAFGRWPAAAELRSPGWGGWPPINIGATPERVDIQQNLLTIAGQRSAEVSEEMRPYRTERFSGEFRRAVTLPDDVDPERVDASYRDGVLHVSVQRLAAAQPRRITVS
jgi:HSP20 family protein